MVITRTNIQLFCTLRTPFDTMLTLFSALVVSQSDLCKNIFVLQIYSHSGAEAIPRPAIDDIQHAISALKRRDTSHGMYTPPNKSHNFEKTKTKKAHEQKMGSPPVRPSGEVRGRQPPINKPWV